MNQYCNMKKPYSLGFRLSVCFIVFIILPSFCYINSAKGQDKTVKGDNTIVSKEEDTAVYHPLSLEHHILPLSITGDVHGPNLNSTACQNSDFSLGNFTNWRGCSGTWCNDVNPGQTRCNNPYVPFNPPL